MHRCNVPLRTTLRSARPRGGPRRAFIEPLSAEEAYAPGRCWTPGTWPARRERFIRSRVSASSHRIFVTFRVFAGTIAGLLALGRASATQADDAPSDRIGELVERAVEHRRRGEDAEALELLLEADRISSSPPLDAQIGLAEQALGRWVDAEVRLVSALSQDDPWIGAHRIPLESALERVRDHLGWLEVRCSVEGAGLFVQGVPVGSLPRTEPLRVAVGTAVVEVRASGHHAMRRAVTIEPRRLSREEIVLVPLPAKEEAISIATPSNPHATTATRSDSPVPPGLRPAGWALLAVGAASVTAGVFAWSVRERAVRGWNDDSRCDRVLELDREAECGDLRDRYQLGQRAAAALFGVGSAMVITGAVLLWLGRKPLPSGATACALEFAPLAVGCRLTF